MPRLRQASIYIHNLCISSSCLGLMWLGHVLTEDACPGCQLLKKVSEIGTEHTALPRAIDVPQDARRLQGHARMCTFQMGWTTRWSHDCPAARRPMSSAAAGPAQGSPRPGWQRLCPGAGGLSSDDTALAALQRHIALVSMHTQDTHDNFRTSLVLRLLNKQLKSSAWLLHQPRKESVCALAGHERPHRLRFWHS